MLLYHRPQKATNPTSTKAPSPALSNPIFIRLIISYAVVPTLKKSGCDDPENQKGRLAGLAPFYAVNHSWKETILHFSAGTISSLLLPKKTYHFLLFFHRVCDAFNSSLRTEPLKAAVNQWNLPLNGDAAPEDVEKELFEKFLQPYADNSVRVFIFRFVIEELIFKEWVHVRGKLSVGLNKAIPGKYINPHDMTPLRRACSCGNFLLLEILINKLKMKIDWNAETFPLDLDYNDPHWRNKYLDPTYGRTPAQGIRLLSLLEVAVIQQRFSVSWFNAMIGPATDQRATDVAVVLGRAIHDITTREMLKMLLPSLHRFHEKRVENWKKLLRSEKWLMSDDQQQQDENNDDKKQSTPVHQKPFFRNRKIAWVRSHRESSAAVTFFDYDEITHRRYLRIFHHQQETRPFERAVKIGLLRTVQYMIEELRCSIDVEDYLQVDTPRSAIVALRSTYVGADEMQNYIFDETCVKLLLKTEKSLSPQDFVLNFEDYTLTLSDEKNNKERRLQQNLLSVLVEILANKPVMEDAYRERRIEQHKMGLSSWIASDAGAQHRVENLFQLYARIESHADKNGKYNTNTHINNNSNAVLSSVFEKFFLLNPLQPLTGDQQRHLHVFNLENLLVVGAYYPKTMKFIFNTAMETLQQHKADTWKAIFDLFIMQSPRIVEHCFKYRLSASLSFLMETFNSRDSKFLESVKDGANKQVALGDDNEEDRVVADQHPRVQEKLAMMSYVDRLALLTISSLNFPTTYKYDMATRERSYQHDTWSRGSSARSLEKDKVAPTAAEVIWMLTFLIEKLDFDVKKYRDPITKNNLLFALFDVTSQGSVYPCLPVYSFLLKLRKVDIEEKNDKNVSLKLLATRAGWYCKNLVDMINEYITKPYVSEQEQLTLSLRKL